MKKFQIRFFLFINLLLIPNAFSRHLDKIYVYQDEGVSKESLKQTMLSFRNLRKKYTVKTINAAEVKKGVWTKNAILFVMPGGADLFYAKKLNGKGNEIIKKFIKNGGSFLGICAGSYYGSSYVEFDKKGRLEVVGDRELGFFKGKAIGPILAPYDYKTQSGTRAASIHMMIPDIKKIKLFYNGGGFFKNANHYSNTRVVGTYVNQLPAIILIHYGQGQVLLSAVHFEYNPYLLNAKDPHIKKIIKSLRKNNPAREVLFNNLMNLLNVYA